MRKSYLAPRIHPMLGPVEGHVHTAPGCGHPCKCTDRAAMDCRSCRRAAFERYAAGLSAEALLERQA